MPHLGGYDCDFPAPQRPTGIERIVARRLRDAAERAERQRAHKARKAEAARERALAEQPLSLHEAPACLPGALIGGAL